MKIKDLNQRRKKILKAIVGEYIKKARPISSLTLAKREFPELSSATLRNEMLKLDQGGLLFQPHTSAGRIPTIKAFQFFLNNFLKEQKIDRETEKKFLKVIENFSETRKRVKELAKELANQTKEAIVVAFSKDDYFYTGLSYLFSQPEFRNPTFVFSLSRIIDHLDQVMHKIFDKINETKIFLGEENPFGNQCATIFEKLEIDGQKILIGLLGPVRMDYQRNISLIKFIKKIL